MTYKEWLSSLSDDEFYWLQYVYKFNMQKAYEHECEHKKER